MRLFVAVDVDAAARSAIADEQQRLRQRAPASSRIRWVKPEQLHLTLVFLGEVAEPRVNEVVGAYAAPATVEAFVFSLRGCGVFPPRGAPRALWIGIGEGGEALARLEQVMADRARSLALPVEARPFSAHLTIGRWKDSRPSDRRLVTDHSSAKTVARVRVERATLYQSRPGPGGSVYIPLAHATLASAR